MMLGKRPRPSMRRTTSLSEINSGELSQRPRYEAPAAADEPIDFPRIAANGRRQQLMKCATPIWHQRPPLIPVVAGVEPAPFLRICGLCNQLLGPGKDTFIYRGDAAFCSAECRQRRMNMDERMERCSMASRKDPPGQDADAAAAGEVETAVAA